MREIRGLTKKQKSRIINSIFFNSLNASAFVLLSLAELGKAEIEAFFPKNYAFTKLGRKVLGLDSKDVKWQNSTLINNMTKLKRSGLVIKDVKRKIYYLSPEGKKFIGLIKDRYQIINLKWDGWWRLVIFDIPEKKKDYRNWLRNELALLGFKSLQKSVFVGKTPLPESLIEEINNNKLDEYIHFFIINKASNQKSLEEIFR